jgi:ribosomal protein S17E
MSYEKELKQLIDEIFKKHFYYFKESFDLNMNKMDNLLTDTQKHIEEIEGNVDKLLKNKECSWDLQNLIKDDTDDRNIKLLEEVNIALSYLSHKKQNTLYVWITILVIFVLQVITFLKF